MNTVDIVIIVFILIGAYSGYKKGFLMGLVSLAAFFIAIILGIKMLDMGILFLSDYIDGYDNVLPIVAFAIIFIGVVILLNVFGKAIKKVLDMTLLGSLDDLAGALMGMVKSALFISIFIWIYESLSGGLSEDLTKSSYLYIPVSTFAPGLFGLLSGFFPNFMDFFEQSKELINQPDISV